MSKSALIKRQTSHSSSFEFKQIKLTVGILYEIKFDSFKQSPFFS